MPNTTTLWEQGHEPGRSVVALGFALTLSAAALDVLLSDRVGPVFDVVFVVACVTMALLVRPDDFYVIAILPPVLMLVVLGLLALGEPGWVSRPEDRLLQALISGVSHHALALGFGFALCLGCLVVRNNQGDHRSLV